VSDGSESGSLPPWAINLVLWACLVLSGGFTGLLAWFFRKYSGKIDALEKNQKSFATAESVAQMELRIVPLISRTELLAHLEQIRDDQERRNEVLREDQQRMHKENRDDNAAIRSDNAATRSDIRAVHSRIDELFSK
jgi:hypothetical protein